MSLALEQKQGLIAGDGLLPVKMAQYAKDNGFEVVAISLSNEFIRIRHSRRCRRNKIVFVKHGYNAIAIQTF